MGIRALICALALSAPGLGFAAVKPFDESKVQKTEVKVSDAVDRFNGSRVISPRALLSLSGTGLLTTVYFQPVIVHPERGTPVFLVTVTYNGFGWAFLNGRVQLLVNGSERFEAAGPDSSGDRKVISCSSGSCLVEETIRVPMTIEVARAIANAKSVEVRLLGNSGSVLGRVNEKQVAYFRDFVARFSALSGEGTPSATGQSQPADIPVTTLQGGAPENPLARAQMISSGMGCGQVAQAPDAGGRSVYVATCPGLRQIQIDCSSGNCRPMD